MSILSTRAHDAKRNCFDRMNKIKPNAAAEPHSDHFVNSVSRIYMNERYIKWYTLYLSREFEMLVFGDKRGLPLILFPTSGARYYENKDFGLVGAVAWYIDNGRITICCPDSIDLESFYNKSINPANRMRNHH